MRLAPAAAAAPRDRPAGISRRPLVAPHTKAGWISLSSHSVANRVQGWIEGDLIGSSEFRSTCDQLHASAPVMHAALQCYRRTFGVSLGQLVFHPQAFKSTVDLLLIHLSVQYVVQFVCPKNRLQVVNVGPSC